VAAEGVAVACGVEALAVWEGDAVWVEGGREGVREECMNIIELAKTCSEVCSISISDIERRRERQDASPRKTDGKEKQRARKSLETEVGEGKERGEAAALPQPPKYTRLVHMPTSQLQETKRKP